MTTDDTEKTTTFYRKIGLINAKDFNIDFAYKYTKTYSNLAIVLDIPNFNSHKKGYVVKLWILYIKRLLKNGIEEI